MNILPRGKATISRGAVVFRNLHYGASDLLDENLYKRLKHGKMKGSEKEAIMSAFLAKEIDILVATTVVEVGVNVPNASVMVIESAERLGLAQLHQLRGRVGRGSDQAYCFLLAGDKNSRRLDILCQTEDGFKIAEEDMRIRGTGELLGHGSTAWQNCVLLIFPKMGISWRRPIRWRKKRCKIRKDLNCLFKKLRNDIRRRR